MISRIVDYARVVWFAILFVVIGIPIFVIQESTSLTQRVATSDQVWIQEMNPNLQKTRDFIDCETSWVYAKTSSLEEAEDWLLSHGYKKARFTTTQPGGTFSSSYKTFPVKGNGHYVSVINIIVDYGDGVKRVIFFRNPDGESGFNFSRFEKANSSRMFDFPHHSTDVSGYHLDGTF